jgi:hypothetical protein
MIPGSKTGDTIDSYTGCLLEYRDGTRGTFCVDTIYSTGVVPQKLESCLKFSYRLACATNA